MRALTLTQPWCGLVASGAKLVENRPRPMILREDFGKPFGLHASREIDEHVYDRIEEIDPDIFERVGCLGSHWHDLTRITSAVIAVATIKRAVFEVDGQIKDLITGEVVDLGDQRRWFFGRIGYLLRPDVRALKNPVPCKGALGFWRMPADVESSVMAQLGGDHG